LTEILSISGTAPFWSPCSENSQKKEGCCPGVSRIVIYIFVTLNSNFQPSLFSYLLIVPTYLFTHLTYLPTYLFTHRTYLSTYPLISSTDLPVSYLPILLTNLTINMFTPLTYLSTHLHTYLAFAHCHC